ncbi:MAG: hypothetical protein ACOWWM_05325 [Desulfobacterales bacterium]
MKRFDIVFRGEILLENDLESVKSGLARLLKSDPHSVEKYFSGDEFVLRKGVAEQAALRIQEAARGIGAVFDLRINDSNEVQPSPKRPHHRIPPPIDPTPPRYLTCPNCGTPQPKAAACINCGAFLIGKPRRSPGIEGAPRPMATADRSLNGVSMRAFFRGLRIFFLASLLVLVAAHAYLTRARTTDWNDSLRVGIYPINGDGDPATGVFINTLSELTFEPISRFFAREADRHGVELDFPAIVHLAPEVESLPPAPPAAGSRLGIMLWSLRFRLWVMRADTLDEITTDIRMFVVFQGNGSGRKPADSFGLEKGLAGVVYGFADSRFSGKNNIVIAHEILHTLGARDKYDPITRQPIYPDGFAEPDRSPPYPQRWAEIMAGRVAVSPDQSQMPEGLEYVLIGPRTASEIRWI